MRILMGKILKKLYGVIPHLDVKYVIVMQRKMKKHIILML